MLNSQRAFVNAVKTYCARNGITVEERSQGWLLVMQRGEQRRLAIGYDLGLNRSSTQRIANDKAATAEVLELCDVPCVPHALFLGPKLSRHVPPQDSWRKLLELLDDNPKGLVVKPNEGTSGEDVVKVRSTAQLETAVTELFCSHLSLSVSPYLAIDREVRVILVDYDPMVVYSKQRPSIVGDGRHTALQLAMATISPQRLARVLPGIVEELGPSSLSEIVPAGECRPLNWRHNLGAGADPVILEVGPVREACVRLATSAAKAIGLRFGSVDVVEVQGSWRVLEINSGVMMEAFGQLRPDLVEATYCAALDKLFDEVSARDP